MSKNHSKQQDFKTREQTPGVNKTPKGVEVLCPFCKPSHPILPGVESPCGTILRVTAVQGYMTSHATRHRNIKCLKCGQTGEEMVKYGTGWVHMIDCAPGTRLLPVIPRFSPWAAMVLKMRPNLRAWIEKRTGMAQQVREIDDEGKETGKILGCFFMKGSANAKHTESNPG